MHVRQDFTRVKRGTVEFQLFVILVVSMTKRERKESERRRAVVFPSKKIERKGEKENLVD